MSAPREPDERGANGQKTFDRLGFPVNKDNGCPLFVIEPTVNNVGDLLAIVKRVTQYQVVATSCWFESGQGHHFAVRSCSRLFAEGEIMQQIPAVLASVRSRLCAVVCW